MVYTYKCKNCSNIFEIDHPMSVNNAVQELGSVCSNCGSHNIFKYLGLRKTVPIHFKGTGFAINDLALDKIGFPKHYKENPEVREKIKNM